MKQFFPLFIVLLTSFVNLFSQTAVKKNSMLMGCHFDITVVSEDSSQSIQFIEQAEKEIISIEKLISSWDPHSQTSLINVNAGIKPVEVDIELYNLIERSIKISELTNGAFDISYASMDNVWKFDGTMTTTPTPEEIQHSIAKIGYNNIILDKNNRTIFLKEKGMRIGFGAIGKGYAADKAKKLLIAQGAKSGIINASGDMNTWGTQVDGSAWNVAITNPMNKDVAFGMLPIKHGAVVTSGNYEKVITLEGKRYSHIIDPRSGYPTQGILSVTVFAPKAELADALATAVFVMGIEVGLHFIEQIPNVECLVIDSDGNIHSTSHIKLDTP